MAQCALEVADIFRAHGPAWRKAQHGHLSLGQLKVMSAIEQCRSVALSGHVLRCEDCGHDRIAYNSCRNRHCPKYQADLLPVDYYHVDFSLRAPISAIANKRLVFLPNPVPACSGKQAPRTQSASSEVMGLMRSLTPREHDPCAYSEDIFLAFEWPDQCAARRFQTPMEHWRKH